MITSCIIYYLLLTCSIYQVYIVKTCSLPFVSFSGNHFIISYVVVALFHGPDIINGFITTLVKGPDIVKFQQLSSVHVIMVICAGFSLLSKSWEW